MTAAPLTRAELRLLLATSLVHPPGHAELTRLLDPLVGDLVRATTAAAARDELERVLMRADLLAQLSDVAAARRRGEAYAEDDLAVGPTAGRLLGAQAATRLVEGFRYALGWAAALDNLVATGAIAPLPGAAPGDAGDAGAYPRHMAHVRAHTALPYWTVEADYWRSIIASVALQTTVARGAPLPPDVAMLLVETFGDGLHGALRQLAADAPGVVPEALVPAATLPETSAVRRGRDEASWARLVAQSLELAPDEDD